MKKQSTIAAAVLAVTAVRAGSACAAEFAGLQAMEVSEVTAVVAEVPAPPVPKAALRANGTPIDGWLDGRAHDHMAPGPLGPNSKYVLYSTLVKDENTLYLQAFSPVHGLDYLADFRTSLEYALADLASLRSDSGYSYLVAFEQQNYSPAAASRVNMLVVEFDSGKMLRFAIVRGVPAGDIKDGKFKAYVPSDAKNKHWSPWMAEVSASSVAKAAPDRNTSPITKVENPKYVCQTHGGGHAVALNGNSARVWQVDGAEEGAQEGLELNNVVLTRHPRPDHLDIAGTLSFYGETIKLDLAIRTDANNPGNPYMIVKINGEEQEPPLEKVPCKIVY